MIVSRVFSSAVHAALTVAVLGVIGGTLGLTIMGIFETYGPLLAVMVTAGLLAVLLRFTEGWAERQRRQHQPQ